MIYIFFILETNHSIRMLEKIETQNVNKLMQLINTYEIYSDKLPSVMLKKSNFYILH
jgi:hypothetical protein